MTPFAQQNEIRGSVSPAQRVRHDVAALQAALAAAALAALLRLAEIDAQPCLRHVIRPVGDDLFSGGFAFLSVRHRDDPPSLI